MPLFVLVRLTPLADGARGCRDQEISAKIPLTVLAQAQEPWFVWPVLQVGAFAPVLVLFDEGLAGRVVPCVWRRGIAWLSLPPVSSR